jgi:23S rRNA pseudouridine2605 synthase
MPRDNDKDNDSRGRRDRPGGGKGRAGGGMGRAEGGKGRSGAARGPEKKFAKRGFGARDDAGGERRPYAGKSDGAKAFGRKPYAGKRDGDERPPRRDFGDRPRPRFDRDERPRGDRPERSPRKDFRAREDRDGEKRPFKPRGDRPDFDRDRDSRPQRRARDDARPAGRFQDKKFGDKRPYTPRGEGFRKDGDRPRGDRPYGDRPSRDGEKRFSRGPRKDFGDRPERGEDKPWQKRDDRGGRDSRPSRDGARNFDRPRFDRQRNDRDGDERPRFSRSREDRPTFDRPRERRDRDGDRGRPAGRTEWQEHPRSEGRFSDRPRRDNEDDSKVFAKRPAFGGRGAYRERTPDFDKRAPRAEPKPKKAGERIAKVVARAGLASRRDAEELITAGRVTVNGRVINSPALDVTANDVIAVDGKVLPPRERTRLFMYHKPRGLMTTHDDPEGRPTVFDNLPEGLPRLISIGRLDFNTEGLLLLTNDGGLARALELPDTGWLRRYRVRAHGEVTQAQLDELKKGVEVDGVKYGPIDAQLERDQGANVWVVFAIREGKNREVRNVMAHLGLEVNRLIRVSYGPFQLGELAEGQVEEVKTRVLREQLGEKIATLAGADFNRPAQDDKSADDDDAPRGKKPFKPAGKSALIADRKGRRVLVQRTGSEEARARNEDEANGYGPPRRPKRGYHGKRDLKPRDE